MPVPAPIPLDATVAAAVFPFVGPGRSSVEYAVAYVISPLVVGWEGGEEGWREDC